MSVMERRLQLLLDADRYARVSAEAKRSGRSVAAVIRDAIDYRFPDAGDAGRMQAAAELLRTTATSAAGRGESAAQLKAAYSEYLDDKLARQ